MKLKDNFRLLLLALFVVALVMPLLPTTALGADPALYEYLNDGDDAAFNITNINLFGQTFTTNSTIPHTITQIRVKLARVGTPGTITGRIYRTSGGLPIGASMGTGTISGDGLTTDVGGFWYGLTLNEEVTILPSTQYAIVLVAYAGSSSNYVLWRYDNGNGLAGGTEITSSNGGIGWSTVGANDMMFEIWGGFVMEITDGKVYSDFLETGDQLFVFRYKVFVGAAYEADNPEDYFSTQLLVSSVVKAQGKLPAWGFKPGSIYLNALSASAWGPTNVTIRLVGITGTPFSGRTADYALVTSKDWIGEDLKRLDTWVMDTASAMQKFYSITLIDNDHLNTDGGSMFKLGIPGLYKERPGIFGVQARKLPAKKAFTPTLQDKLNQNFGSSHINATNELGDMIGVGGDFIRGSLWLWIVVIGISVMGVSTGNSGIALIAALPLLLAGVYMGAIPLNWVLVPTFVLAAYAIAKLTIYKAS